MMKTYEVKFIQNVRPMCGESTTKIRTTLRAIKIDARSAESARNKINRHYGNVEIRSITEIV